MGFFCLASGNGRHVFFANTQYQSIKIILDKHTVVTWYWMRYFLSRYISEADILGLGYKNIFILYILIIFWIYFLYIVKKEISPWNKSFKYTIMHNGDQIASPLSWYMININQHVEFWRIQQVVTTLHLRFSSNR